MVVSYCLKCIKCWKCEWESIKQIASTTATIYTVLCAIVYEKYLTKVQNVCTFARVSNFTTLNLIALSQENYQNRHLHTHTNSCETISSRLACTALREITHNHFWQLLLNASAIAIKLFISFEEMLDLKLCFNSDRSQNVDLLLANVQTDLFT